MHVHVEHRMFIAFDLGHPVGPPLDDVPAGAWEESASATLSAPSGRLRVSSIMRMPAGPDVALGPAGDYAVRVHARGRGEAMERIGVELEYEGVEGWLLELWPAHARAADPSIR